MQWVVYLSPSGGQRRPGVVDDGCVHGYPGVEDLQELLNTPREQLLSAHGRALAEPTEIIVEFEARLCAPLQPSVMVWPGPDREHHLDPQLVVGTDDGVVAPSGESSLSMQLGLATAPWGQSSGFAHAPACLWRRGDGSPVALTVGPALTLTDTGFAAGQELVATVGAETVARLELSELAVREATASIVEFAGAAPTVELGAELHVDAAHLGEFEVRLAGG